MTSNPYGQNPYQSGNYEDYSQGGAAQQPPYGQSPASGQQPPAYGQSPYSQQSPTYAAQPQYGQQPPTYGQAPTSGYEQPSYAQTYDPYSQPTYGAPPQAGYNPGLAPYTATANSTPRPSVTMVQAVKLWLKNWKNFSGRASQSEYWYVMLAILIAEFAVGIIVAILGFVIFAATATTSTASSGGGADAVAGLVFFLMYGVVILLALAAVVPSISLGIRRLHDTNQSGWLMLVGLVPSVGGIIQLILMAQPSNPMGARFDDPNQPLYGPENL